MDHRGPGGRVLHAARPRRPAGPAAAPLPGGGGGLDLRHQRRPGPFGRRAAGRGRGHGDAAQVRPRRPDPPELRGGAGRAGRRADRRLDLPRRPRPGSHRPLPATARSCPWDEAEALGPGTRFGVRQGVAWVRHLEGRSRFLDEIALPASELEARFPLSEHLWLSAETACRVTASDTLTMVRSGDPWAGLMDFHRAVLDELARDPGAGSPPALVRAPEHDRRRARCSWAVSRSSSPRWPTRRPSPIARTAGDALLAACRAVGQELGMEVRPPRRSSDDDRPAGSETLEEIARASGFHIRQVTLPQDWAWRRSGEPLLGPARRRARAGPSPCCRGATAARAASPPGAYDLYDPVDGPPPARHRVAGPAGRPDGLDVLSHPPRSSPPARGPPPLRPARGSGARSGWWSSWRSSPGCSASPCRSARASWSIRSSRRSISRHRAASPR